MQNQNDQLCTFFTLGFTAIMLQTLVALAWNTHTHTHGHRHADMEMTCQHMAMSKKVRTTQVSNMCLTCPTQHGLMTKVSMQTKMIN